MANARLKAIGLEPLFPEAIYKKMLTWSVSQILRKKLTRRQTSLRRVSPVTSCPLALKVGMISKKGLLLV
ncbi:hypothetical protein [Nostoc sp.]|uniref:hypothetical protein n=1 Tax=Nostoc sp. TaxID=1180 RepID=UPI002FF510F8